MAVYEITAPNGDVFEVTAPDEATEQEVLAYAQAQWDKPAASQADVRKSEPQPKKPGLAESLTADLKGLAKLSPAGVIAEGVKGATEGLDKLAHGAGEKATDLASSTGASPEVAAAAGLAANVAVQAPLALAGGPVSKAKQLGDVVKSRAALAEAPEGKRAVEELVKRTTDDIVPSPGQVSGEASMAERAARAVNPGKFKKSGEDIERAAEKMRQETMYPGVQPSAKTLGERVLQEADDVQKAVKTRLRPAFQAADDLGVRVDLNPLVTRAQQMLARADKTPGILQAQERAALEEIVAKLGGKSHPNAMYNDAHVTAEAALDIISAQKAKLRATPEYTPSTFFEGIVGGMVKDADSAFVQAAGKAGKGDVVKNLLAARTDYREMMETIYDDAIKAALKKNPEDIGRHFWQGGNVSEIEQLQKMYKIAQREGTMTAGEVTKASRDMTRGFLQESAKDINAISKWSQTIASDPVKRRTWETLTATPGGAQLRDAMKVLEEAAKIASRSNSELLGQNAIAISRVAQGGLGISYVSGVVRPGIALTGLSLTGLVRMMATAYSRGNTGIVRNLARLLKANNVRTTAGVKTVQEVLPEIEKAAVEYGINDIFTFEGE